MPRRKKVIDVHKELPEWIDNPDVVSEEEMRGYRNLTGVRRELDRRYPDGWNDDNLRTYIVERHHYKIQLLFQERNTRIRENEVHEQRVKQIVASYLEHFIKPTPNDILQIEEMARIELGLSELDKRLKAITSSTKDMTNTRDLEILAKTRRDMLSAFQSLEKNLGIDRESRHQESDTVSMFQQIKEQASALLSKRSRSIICPACEKDGRTINAGFVVFHFDKNDIPWEFRWECPMCKKIQGLTSRIKLEDERNH